MEEWLEILGYDLVLLIHPPNLPRRYKSQNEKGLLKHSQPVFLGE
jgi:hypothetical protein